MIIIVWILGAIFIPFVLAADERKIGYWLGFLACLFLSPLVGLIIILFSKDKNEVNYNKEIYKKLQQESHLNNQNNSISDELNKLAKMRDKGILSEEEFQRGKEKLLL